MAATSGLVEPVSISASKGEPAKLKCRVHLTSTDGDAAPITVGTSSITLAAPTVYYTLGILTLGSAVGGVQRSTFEWGYEISKDTGESGLPYPVLLWSDSQSAKITAKRIQMKSRNLYIVTGPSFRARKIMIPKRK